MAVITGPGTEGAYTLDKIALYKVLDHIHPTLPITVADCQELYDMIRNYVPSNLRADVMHDGKAIHVRLHDAVPECVFYCELKPLPA